MPPNPRQPLINYLGVQRRVDRELNVVLQQAARDAETAVRALVLGPPGVGQRVRVAQLTDVLRAIRELQDQLWRQGIGPLIERSVPAAQEAAVAAREYLDSVLFEALPTQQAEALRASIRDQTLNGMRADATRIARELSPRVYNNAALSSRAVERTIRAGIIQGLSSQELARSVRIYIDPRTPGGVTYAARRLARTELNNAFHEQQKAQADADHVLGCKWNLSGSHPKPDECDQYAKENRFELGVGVFPSRDVPDKPHPQCLCFLTYELEPEDDFVRRIRREFGL